LHFANVSAGSVHALAQSYVNVTPVSEHVHVPAFQAPFDPLHSHLIDRVLPSSHWYSCAVMHW